MKKRFLILILLLFLPIAYARQGHMPLLAVKEVIGGYEGSIADLYLEIQPGTGRVFMETYPLTKMDTQISTRFAKDVACNYLEIDCSQYDFFYTIKADSPIVGGPSAGAAIAVLTIAVLEEFDVNDNIAITGTINSGGLIGPVGSLIAKIEAASEIGVKTVLIPKGEGIVKELNLSIKLSEYAEKYNITIIEVGDLTSALYEFTGKYYRDLTKELVIDPEYIKTMGFLGEMLCNRSDYLSRFFSELQVDKSNINKDILETEKKAVNRTEQGKQALNKKQYYSSASYCFGANVNYQYLIVKLGNFTNFEEVRKEIDDFENSLKNIRINTVADLEAYMVVQDRLSEAREYLNQSIKKYEKGEDFSEALAYSIERVYSAKSWSNFFGAPGKVFDLQENNLEQGCVRKLVEAEERVQYADLFYQRSVQELEDSLELVKEDFEKGNYAMCLFKASKIKAEADVILSVVGVEEEQIETVLDNKLEIVKRVIIEAQEKGIFPILGYSYYEYANSLKEENKYTSLLYAEYALELSNLNLYFKEPSQETKWGIEKIQIKPKGKAPVSLIFIIGLFLGFLTALTILKRHKSKKRKDKKIISL
jgi:uncharacterized protein